MTDKLYYGDNLQVLRDYIADESVDLIYLDPPFNSNASYSILFKSPEGKGADAQIEAFDDTWKWGPAASSALMDITQSGNHALHTLMQAMKTAIGENAMMAYLAMMAVRLVELHRVLKPTGSLYLHCDPTASHYLKLVLDAVFGPANFVNEIVWKRSDAHNDAKQGATHFGRIHDVIFRYQKTDRATHNATYIGLPDSTVEKRYRNVEEGTGRLYNKADVTAPGGANPQKRNPHYEWNGVTRYWRYSKERMQQLHDEGRLVYSSSGMTYQKRYLDESKGIPLQDWWDDIAMLRGLHGQGERLGYPTQKPRALLERIIEASSNPGDTVLDPFCGCGTAIDAAQKLGRQWIGIDVTHLAIGLVEKRLRESYGPNNPPRNGEGDHEVVEGAHASAGANIEEGVPSSTAGPLHHPPSADGSPPRSGEDRFRLNYEVIGVPKDLASAQKLAEDKPHDFQNWICLQLGGWPWMGGRKGGDKGVDGYFYYVGEGAQTETGVISVKAGHNVNPGMVRDLWGVMQRDKHKLGLFVCAALPTKGMEEEANSHGLVETEFGRFPALQLFTLAELFQDRRPKLPPLVSPNRKAPRVETRVSHQKGSQGELL